MNIVRMDLLPVFEMCRDKINIIVIENNREYYNFVYEFYAMSNGEDGKIIISENNVPLKIKNSVEMIVQLIPFEMNNKKLQTKLYNYFVRNSLCEDMYGGTLNIQSKITEYIEKLTENSCFELEFNDCIDINALLKAVELRFCGDYDTLSEKIFEYMNCVRELEGDKLFVVNGLLNYISKSEADLMFKTLIDHDIRVLLVENMDVDSDVLVNKIIVDRDLCII